MRSPRFRLRSFGPIEGRSDRPHYIARLDQPLRLLNCGIVNSCDTCQTLDVTFLAPAMRRGQPALRQALTLSFRQPNLPQPERQR